MSSPVLIAPWWADVDAELGDPDLPRRRIVPSVSCCPPEQEHRHAVAAWAATR